MIHDIAYSTLVNEAENKPEFVFTTDTPYLTLTCKEFEENWPRCTVMPSRVALCIVLKAGCCYFHDSCNEWSRNILFFNYAYSHNRYLFYLSHAVDIKHFFFMLLNTKPPGHSLLNPGGYLRTSLVKPPVYLVDFVCDERQLEYFKAIRKFKNCFKILFYLAGITWDFKCNSKFQYQQCLLCDENYRFG